MKKAFILMGLASLMTLASCGASSNLVLYNDSNVVTDGDLTIRYSKSSEYSNYGSDSSVYFSFYLYFLNKNTKQSTIKVSFAKIYREKDKAEYNVSSSTFSFGLGLDLPCDIEKGANFYATLPNKTTEEKYYMVLEFNPNKKLTCYFYDKVLTL